MINKIDLRKVFVQLLFSLAIGNVAMRAGDLIAAHATFNEHYYAYAHLILCVFIITSSWVGWHNSVSPHNSDIINDVISWHYVVLLLDLILVICYFIIVRGAESPPDGKGPIPYPSASVESRWTVYIFIIYLIWDFTTKLFSLKYVYQTEKNTFLRHRVNNLPLLIERIWPTVLCAFLAIIVFGIVDNEKCPLKVTLADIWIFSIFYIFRGLKQKVKREYNLSRNQLTSEVRRELRNQAGGVLYPIVIEENRIYRWKIFIVKIFPFVIFIACFILYFTI